MKTGGNSQREFPPVFFGNNLRSFVGENFKKQSLANISAKAEKNLFRCVRCAYRSANRASDI